MRRGRAAAVARRAAAASGLHVVGRFVLADGQVVLEAIALQPGYWIDPRAPLTRSFSDFYRWRTRQAAWQWLERNGDDTLQVVNLSELPGREPGPAAGGLTRRKRRGRRDRG